VDFNTVDMAGEKLQRLLWENCRGFCGKDNVKKLRCLDENFRNFQSLLSECGFESFNDPGIEIRAGCFGDHVASLERRNAFAIRPVAHERIVNVSHADDTRFDGNFVAFGRMVSRSVEFIVMGQHDG